MLYDLCVDTKNGNVYAYLGKYTNRVLIKSFIHPIQNKKLYMFETTKPVFEKRYLLSGLLSKKTKYANIFDDDMQKEIDEWLNR